MKNFILCLVTIFLIKDAPAIYFPEGVHRMGDISPGQFCFDPWQCEEAGIDPFGLPGPLGTGAPREPAEATSLSPIQECQEDLRQFFLDPSNPHVQRYLELQSDITAHRLAWSYMILWKKRGKGLEGVIKDLVAQRDADPQMRELYEEFRFLNSYKTNRQMRRYTEDYLSRQGNEDINIPGGFDNFRRLRLEQVKHSLIAASMGSMRSTLVEDFAVPEDSPFLLQQEDINLGNLLDTVANGEQRTRVLHTMTNLMETVDRSYDMGEYTNRSAFRTEWRRADSAKGREAGYQGITDENDLPMDAEGSHHEAQGRAILSRMNDLRSAMGELIEAIKSGIASCNRNDTWITLIGGCPADTPDILNEKMAAFVNSSGIIANTLNEKYQSEPVDSDITDALSRGGKVLESSDFNPRNFCDNPARYVCDSREARASDRAEDRYQDIISNSFFEGIEAFTRANRICTDGPRTGQACSGGCTCEQAESCTDYANMTTRRGCFNAQTDYQIENMFTDSVQQRLQRQLNRAQRDIQSMLDAEPFASQIPNAQRENLKRVIGDATLQIPQRGDYSWGCSFDSSVSCNSDRVCQTHANGDASSTCQVENVDWNMYAGFGGNHPAPHLPHYSTGQRPRVVAEGMALTDSRTMYGIILHELGHLITPDHNINGRISGATVGGNNPFAAQLACFQRDELSAGSNPANAKVDEAIADGIQAQVIGLKVKKAFPQTRPGTFNPRAIQYVREYMADLCNSYLGTNNNREITNLRTAHRRSSHPDHEDRINRIIFANKHISGAIGCNLPENQKNPPKYNTPLQQCMNNP